MYNDHSYILNQPRTTLNIGLDYIIMITKS